jgi:diguanylate cyclase (GGDEF)-like protein
VEPSTSENAYSPSTKEKVFSEQVKILHNSLPTSVPANLICAFIVFISLYSGQNKIFVTGWFIAVMLVSLFRFVAMYFFRRQPENDDLYLRIFMVGVTLSALLWSTINSFFMPKNDLSEQMIIIIMTVGVTAGGIQTLNANLKVSLAFLCMTIFPLAAWIFLQGSFNYTLLGITLIVFIVFMIVTTIRGNKLLATTLSLQYENQALIEKISVTNTKLLNYSKILYKQSTHDPLTGLYNRRYLDEALSRELKRVIREKKSSCVAMLDLDFFKSFNDTNGHAAGDEMLKFVAATMQATFRGSDISCRFGGEEFLILLINTDLSSAQLRLENFCEAVKKGEVYFQGQLLPPMTVSVGVAEAPRQGTSAKDIIHAADTALYCAKETGRNRVKCSSVSIDTTKCLA